jgi:hypothetical protein
LWKFRLLSRRADPTWFVLNAADPCLYDYANGSRDRRGAAAVDARISVHIVTIQVGRALSPALPGLPSESLSTLLRLSNYAKANEVRSWRR